MSDGAGNLTLPGKYFSSASRGGPRPLWLILEVVVAWRLFLQNDRLKRYSPLTKFR